MVCDTGVLVIPGFLMRVLSHFFFRIFCCLSLALCFYKCSHAPHIYHIYIYIPMQNIALYCVSDLAGRVLVISGS